MRVWLMQIGEPLPLDRSVRKLRTALMADVLAKAGHDVVWWASTFEHQRKQQIFKTDTDVQLADNYKIIALKGIAYRRNVSLRRYLDHRLVARKFKNRAPTMDAPDVIIASMPTYDLAYEAVVYARERGIPIIVDVRDLWPDIFLDQLSGLLRSSVARFLAGDFQKLGYLLKNASGLTAMSQGVLNWALGYAWRGQTKRDRVFHLGYKAAQSAQEGDVGPDFSVLLDNCAGKQICAFVGTHGVSYELSLVLDVAQRMYEKDGDSSPCFVIAGSGQNSARLMERAESLPNVYMPGWLNAYEIAALLERAYVGIVPCRSVRDAYPNKPIEYMSAGLPIISSVEGEMARMVEDEGVGLNYRPGDREGLYKAVKELGDDSGLRDGMSRAAGDVFKRLFDADKIYGEYVEYIQQFVRKD